MWLSPLLKSWWWLMEKWRKLFNDTLNELYYEVNQVSCKRLNWLKYKLLIHSTNDCYYLKFYINVLVSLSRSVHVIVIYLIFQQKLKFFSCRSNNLNKKFEDFVTLKTNNNTNNFYSTFIETKFKWKRFIFQI